MAGVDAAQRPLGDEAMLHIEELDVRADAGAGLVGSNERVVAEWQVPTGIVRGYSTAPAHELRIITVMGDSMEPSLLPGQRVLVDTGDKKPSPPGIFVVWDGLGLVVKRVQVVPHSRPVARAHHLRQSEIRSLRAHARRGLHPGPRHRPVAVALTVRTQIA